MDREQVLNKLRAVLPELRDEFGVAELYLFGSLARGDHRPGSDVDLVVQFAPGTHPTLFTLAGLYGRLVDLLGCPVDLGTRDSLRPRIRPEVEAEMVRVA
jgi:predicted nucleotidyltransferase